MAGKPNLQQAGSLSGIDYATQQVVQHCYCLAECVKQG